MKYTPAIQQYIDIKKQNSDCLLFFRLGDFYELFFDDAKLVSKALDLVLTSKNKNSPNPIPMAGIPHHSAEKYINKLVSLGYKVAIAEQITEPKPGQIVEREVVEIITPATYIKDSESKNFSYILSITHKSFKNGENYHIAWGDFSLGEYNTKSFEKIEETKKFIVSIDPVEVILDVDLPEKSSLWDSLKKELKSLISVYEIPFDLQNYVLEQCKIQNLNSYGQALESGRINAFGLLLNYLKYTQKNNLNNIVRIAFHSPKNRVLIDDITIKNLEIFYNNYENLEKYSLVGVLDNTKTSAGGRLLRKLLLNPTNDLSKLEKRTENIQYYYDNLEKTKEIHNVFGNVLDIQKIVSTILYKKLSPIIFIKLRYVLSIFFENNNLLEELKRLGLTKHHLETIENLYKTLEKVLKNDEFIKNDIDFIADGYNKEIDRLRKIAYHSDEMLMDYQNELAKVSKVSNVKLKYIINQGYFIEITNKDIQLFESNLASMLSANNEKFNIVRRNTLKGSQRYNSEFLEQIENKIMEAKSALIEQEFLILQELKDSIELIINDLHIFSNYVSWLDLYTSHAIFAKENNLIKTNYLEKGNLEILEGRHLVVEKFLDKNLQFIPNDLLMSQGNIPSQENKEDLGFVNIITGPNMGGKSTYLRQNALIILMAHCGLFVPAKVAKIPLIDGIFARIGSGDNLAKNQSTFMTEMLEVSNILNNASKNSFIIFDELGRGTSTYDGLALTKAILEYVVMEIKAKTLIATHYHELIALEESYQGIKNYSVSVYETDKDVVFMKKIVKGGADKSYGLDVAKLAGIPNIILQRAEENLNKLHSSTDENKIQKFNQDLFNINRFAKVEDPKYEKIKSMINSFDINNLTPLQALQLLAKIKDELKD
ncbi:MAG: DNA mismatch repair protein MutS [Candidatus Absconditabacterales bacterium]|nr:DNA mismatch repair protein MutS [Candidatus Absconditabacterales bacterium]